MSRNKRKSDKGLAFAASCSIALLILIVGCYEPKEGCLDISASNFDVSADDPCPDCCTYPKLSLEVLHRVVLQDPDTTLKFSYDSLYVIPAVPDVEVRFQRVRFYLSGLKLQRGGESFGVTDSLDLRVPGVGTDSVTIAVENNFALLDRDLPQARILGVFRENGQFDGLRFQIGLPPAIRSADPASAPASHPLRVQADSLLWEDGTGYLAGKIVFFRDTLPGTDSTVVRLLEPVEVVLPLAEPVFLDEGFDVAVTLQIDYLRCFEGIDLETADPEAIAAALVNNLPNAFSIVDIASD